MKKYHVVLTMILLILIVQVLSGFKSSYTMGGADDAIDIHNSPEVIKCVLG